MIDPIASSDRPDLHRPVDWIKVRTYMLKLRAWPAGLFLFTPLLLPLACGEDSTAIGDPASVTDGGRRDSGTRPNTDDDPSPDGPKVTNETVDVGGTSRAYVLSVPRTYDEGRSYPLIVALHGDGGTAKDFTVSSGLGPVAGEDAILAYPDQSLDLFTPYDENTDQLMIAAIIDAVKSGYSVDTKKIWGFGYSKGAFQLNEIACKRPGVFTAMAIHAGGAPQSRDPDNEDVIDCPNAVAIATFVEHGESDEETGGAAGGKFGADYWAGLANCNVDQLSPSTPDICQAYDGCDAATPVVFCAIPGYGHYPLYENAARDSWSWFKAL